MKNWKIPLILIIIFLTSLGTVKFLGLVNNLSSENHKNKLIKDYRIKLKNCFDLENKYNRRIDESLKLVEYCIKEFGLK